MTSPADIVNQALDLLGADGTVGDLQEGTPLAAIALRHYGPTLRQVLRAARWNFARKQALLLLLQDATGQTTAQQIAAGGPVTVGTGTVGMRPWVFEYQYPIDCVQARFVPATWFQNAGTAGGNITLPSQTGLLTTQSALPYVRQVPTRFVITTDNNPTLVGAITDWSQLPDYASLAGQGPQGGTVVLTNQPNATLVYTALITGCDEWDWQFRQAFIAVLATFLAMPCLKDKKLARIVRDEQVRLAKSSLDEARRTDGDEAFTDVDNIPDWIRTRNAGGAYGNRTGWAGVGGGLGVLGYGAFPCSLGNGSCY